MHGETSGDFHGAQLVLMPAMGAWRICRGAGHGEALFKFEIMGHRQEAKRPSPQQISSV
jgi:hypothetical protein